MLGCSQSSGHSFDFEEREPAVLGAGHGALLPPSGTDFTYSMNPVIFIV